MLDVFVLFLRVHDDGLVELLNLVLRLFLLLDLCGSGSGLELPTIVIDCIDWDDGLRLLRPLGFLNHGLLTGQAVLGFEILLLGGVGFILRLSFGHLYKERFS